MTDTKILYKQEITPIAADDCFAVFERKKKRFKFPIHYHYEYELNCIKYGNGLDRLVGECTGKSTDWELLLTGPNLVHGWLNDVPLPHFAYEKTLQFHANLFDSSLLSRNAMGGLSRLLQQADQGVLFCQKTAETVFQKLHVLAQSEGLSSFIRLQEILQILIDDEAKIVLNIDSSQVHKVDNSLNNKLYHYIQQHYSENIRLEDMAELFNMSLPTFNRMMKKETGNTFVTFLNEYRLGMAARRLLETDYCVEYIAKSCGFQNLSNFNKFFRKVYETAPQRYRLENKGTTAVK